MYEAKPSFSQVGGWYPREYCCIRMCVVSCRYGAERCWTRVSGRLMRDPYALEIRTRRLTLNWIFSPLYWSFSALSM